VPPPSAAPSFIGAFLGPTLGGAAISSGGAQGVFSTFATAAAVCLAAVLSLFIADGVSTHSTFRHPVDHGQLGEPLVPADVPA